MRDNIVFNLRGNIKKNKILFKMRRKTSIIFSRMRCGHTRLTHKHKIEKEPQPICECGEILTVDHILRWQRGSKAREMLKIDPHTILMGDNQEHPKKLEKYLKILKYYEEI